MCERCGYRFRLSPKVPPYCSDGRFTRGIELASDAGARPYTAAQLHGTIFRRRNRMFWHRVFPAKGSRDLEATKGAVREWRRAGKELGPIIHQPALGAAGDGGSWPEPDLFDYGAEGILLVDDPIVVDLLVGCQLHTRTKVAVVAAGTGYPAAVIERLRPLVAARADLPIFLLHGSGAQAPEELEQWAREHLAATDNPFVDIGLPPDASKRLAPLRWARGMPEIPVDVLPHRWLTDGIAAAVANRASFVAMQQPKADDRDQGDGSALNWLFLGDGDFDFG